MRVIFLRSQSQIFPTILPIVSPVNIVFQNKIMELLRMKKMEKSLLCHFLSKPTLILWAGERFLNNPETRHC